MTESEARAAKISEVWNTFKLKDDKFARKHLEELDGVDWDMLRAVLLERCKEVSTYDDRTVALKNRGDYVCVHFFMQDRVMLEIEHLEELAAACSFWAWELKQRENESNG